MYIITCCYSGGGGFYTSWALLLVCARCVGAGWLLFVMLWAGVMDWYGRTGSRYHTGKIRM